MDKKDIEKVIFGRHSTKAFLPQKKVSQEDIEILKKSLINAPSSVNIQSWKIFIVSNEEMKNKLADAAWDANQAKIKNASHYLVFAALEKIDEAWVNKILYKMKDVRKTDDESLKKVKDFIWGNLSQVPEAERIEWAKRQVFLNLGISLFTLEALGIDSSPIEGFSAAAFDKILNLEGTPYKSLVSVAFGYADPAKDWNGPSMAPKVRLDEKEVITELK